MDLIQHLAKKKIITKEQATDLKATAVKLGISQEQAVLNEKIVDEYELFRIKSDIVDVPLKKDVLDSLPKKPLDIIPKESIEFYKMIPLSLKEDVLEVGMVFPENTQAQEAIKFLARQNKFTPKIFLITFSDFKKYMGKYQAPEKEMEKALEVLNKEIEKEGKKEMDSVEFGRLVEEAPIIKMVAVILRQAVEGNASDIHIEPTQEDLRVRFRLDGVLYPSLFLPIRVHSAIIARIKILSRLKIDETRVPQDGRFSTIINNKKIDFRVATFPTNLGEKVAIRVLNPEKGLKSLGDLGLKDRNFEVIKKGIEDNFGMILSTGPTGSGKTTTLYALLRILNKEGVNIVTLEDPVEYFIPGVNQSQVRPEIGYSFAKGLRQILRQDPDIIMVGEIRDEETAALAVHASLTGHLVLSTLHTTTASGVIPRMIDMGVKPFLLPPTINVCISQRLIRKLCVFCKEKKRLEGEQKRYVMEKLKTMPIKKKPELYAYNPKGCKKCKNKGYKGRIGIFEVFKMSPEIAKVISSNPRESEIFKQARIQGMMTIEEDGILKVLEGVTSLEEIARGLEQK